LAIAKSLDILLRAPTGKLDADLKRANALAKSFFSGFSTLAAAAIGGFTLAGFVNQFRSAFTELDSIAKRSLRFGVNVDDIRALDMSAKFAGLNVGELDRAAAVLARNIDRANQGAQEQVKLFDRLGLSAGELIGLSLPQQMSKVAKAFSSIQNATERSSLALQLFEENGQKLIPLFANGGKAISDAIAASSEFGGLISQSDAAKVETSNDAFTRLQFAITALFQRIAIDMAPALTRLFTIIADGLKPGTALNSAFLAFGSILTLAINITNEFAGLLSFASQDMGTLGRAVAGVVAGLAAYIAITKAARLASISFLAVQKALLVIEKGRALINPKTAVAAAAAGVAMFVFADQINGVIESMLGLKGATAEAGAELADFDKIQARATAPRKLNVASAQFGTQAALEQLLTVRSERQGLAQVAAGINESNDLLGQIRDGINAAQGIVGGAGFAEADL